MVDHGIVSNESGDLLAAIEDDIFQDAPIAVTLRKCIVLGGRIGSSELREWAARELEGYADQGSTPDYRRIPAAIKVNAIAGNNVWTGQTISPNVIPEYAREMFAAGPTFYDGIGAIEEMARDARDGGGYLELTHAYSMDLCATIDKESGNPFQQTTALYWSVPAAGLFGIVERVKTRLAQLVGEMRARTPEGQELPTSEVASEAVRTILGGSSRTSKA